MGKKNGVKKTHKKEPKNFFYAIEKGEKNPFYLELPPHFYLHFFLYKT